MPKRAPSIGSHTEHEGQCMDPGCMLHWNGPRAQVASRAHQLSTGHPVALRSVTMNYLGTQDAWRPITKAMARKEATGG